MRRWLGGSSRSIVGRYLNVFPNLPFGVSDFLPMWQLQYDRPFLVWVFFFGLPPDPEMPTQRQ